ncbi:uncharacterized protein LOC141855998 isoform X1 [Brevipalpus obovatus]|uniref:uncharacterized protein LOC141855998 isoform X1 n=1 Tax=Brevipalpus obovatus TaxID=246614 RepID=UPI003D9E5244
MDPKNNQLNRNKHSVVSSDPKSNENYVVRQETSDKQGCFIVYKCANCSFSTDDKVQIKRHRCNYVRSDHRCPQCGLFLAREQWLTSHMKIHQLRPSDQPH